MTDKTLFIHPRKGLYRITKCNTCDHVFQCDQCDANLVTYRSNDYSLMMICHQCQTHYTYPNQCQKCNSKDLSSMVGGADELNEELKNLFGIEPVRYDQEKISQKKVSDSTIAITTRIYDPLIPYSDYAIIVFIHAQNLFASPDYQVLEESMRQIAQLFNELSPNTTIFFDSKITDNAFFETIKGLNTQLQPTIVAQKHDWYEQFLEEEGANRKQFEFPPFHNILLLTSQNKNKKLSLDIIKGVYAELERIAIQLPDLSVTSPYEARFLKRKGMYSYHTLIRYPRQYKHFVPLRKAINELSDRFHVQIRLNPRHLF